MPTTGSSMRMEYMVELAFGYIRDIMERNHLSQRLMRCIFISDSGTSEVYAEIFLAFSMMPACACLNDKHSHLTVIFKNPLASGTKATTCYLGIFKPKL